MLRGRTGFERADVPQLLDRGRSHGDVAQLTPLAAQDAPYADDAELRVLLAPLHRER